MKKILLSAIVLMSGLLGTAAAALSPAHQQLFDTEIAPVLDDIVNTDLSRAITITQKIPLVLPKFPASHPLHGILLEIGEYLDVAIAASSSDDDESLLNLLDDLLAIDTEADEDGEDDMDDYKEEDDDYGHDDWSDEDYEAYLWDYYDWLLEYLAEFELLASEMPEGSHLDYLVYEINDLLDMSAELLVLGSYEDVEEILEEIEEILEELEMDLYELYDEYYDEEDFDDYDERDDSNWEDDENYDDDREDDEDKDDYYYDEYETMDYEYYYDADQEECEDDLYGEWTIDEDGDDVCIVYDDENYADEDEDEENE